MLTVNVADQRPIQKANFDPSEKVKRSAEVSVSSPGLTKRGKVVNRKARLSPNFRATLNDGLNCRLDEPSSRVTPNCPPSRDFSVPSAVYKTPDELVNMSCTFVDSVLSLCKRTIDSGTVKSSTLPSCDEAMFLLLVKRCGLEEARAWAELMGLAYEHSHALLRCLIYGPLRMEPLR